MTRTSRASGSTTASHAGAHAAAHPHARPPPRSGPRLCRPPACGAALTHSLFAALWFGLNPSGPHHTPDPATPAAPPVPHHAPTQLQPVFRKRTGIGHPRKDQAPSAARQNAAGGAAAPQPGAHYSLAWTGGHAPAGICSLSRRGRPPHADLQQLLLPRSRPCG
jgi:hypothetical protein